MCVVLPIKPSEFSFAGSGSVPAAAIQANAGGRSSRPALPVNFGCSFEQAGAPASETVKKACIKVVGPAR
jgi:hypothetical protein